MSQLKPDTLALTILLGLLTALGPLSTDMYLPSLPAIARAFDASSGAAQATLSAYLIGFAAGLPFCGPLADRKGRKPVILLGLALYCVASLALVFSPALPVMIALRAVQGFGAAAPLVIARAVVRDVYEGRRAGQELARMGSIMGIVPAIAPVLGAGLELAFGWRANFVASFLLVGAIMWWTKTGLPETLRAAVTTPFRIGPIFQDFGIIIRDPRFLPQAGVVTMTYAGLFTFISGSSFAYQTHFGASPLAFALAFSLMCIAFITGALVAQRVTMRMESRAMLLVSTGLQSLGGLTMLVATLLFPTSPWTVTIPIMIYALGVSSSLSQGMAGAMMPFPERAGAASSLLGVIQMTFAAGVGLVIGALIDRGPHVLGGGITLCGLVAFVIVLSRRAR